MKKQKTIRATAYRDTNHETLVWVCFNGMAFSAFKSWTRTIATAKGLKIDWHTQRKLVKFCTARKGDKARL